MRLSLVSLSPLGFLCWPLIALASPISQSDLSKRSTSNGSQKVFSFPLKDGFPDIASDSETLKKIEAKAHGSLPHGQLPRNISDTSAIIWEIIAFNELFEVAYFSDLIENITDSRAGYEIGSPAARQVILRALETVRAQEELHALGANGILQAAGRDTVEPCKYVFPVNDFDGAIAFASTFTDIVLGTLQEALTNFGLDGDGPEFLGLVGSVIGNEGEQNGFYRSIGQNKQVPSSQPFLTAAAGTFALSALHQMVIVPGSCPSSPAVPIFDALSIETQDISPQTTELQFSFSVSETKPDLDGLHVVYINQQNPPVVEDAKYVSIDGDMARLTANFPHGETRMDGLTIAAITRDAGPFANASDVAVATLFGPGIIELE